LQFHKFHLQSFFHLYFFITICFDPKREALNYHPSTFHQLHQITKSLFLGRWSHKSTDKFSHQKTCFFLVVAHSHMLRKKLNFFFFTGKKSVSFWTSRWKLEQKRISFICASSLYFISASIGNNFSNVSSKWNVFFIYFIMMEKIESKFWNFCCLKKRSKLLKGFWEAYLLLREKWFAQWERKSREFEFLGFYKRISICQTEKCFHTILFSHLIAFQRTVVSKWQKSD
jgi:hypothetical protein